MARQPEQRRSAQHRESGRDQQCIELARIAGKASCRVPQPCIVGQRGRTDRERRAGHRPRSQLVSKTCGERRRCDGEAQPQAGEAIGLAEGAQNNGIVRQLTGKARFVRQQVDEGFIDDQQPGGDVA